MSIQEKPFTLPLRSPLLWYNGLKTEEEGELVAQQQQAIFHLFPKFLKQRLLISVWNDAEEGQSG